MEDFRIAAVSCTSPLGQIGNNLEQTIHWTRQAHAQGADLVCFPELNLTGYCNSPRASDTALSVPGPVTDRLLRLAADENITILAGLAEHNPRGLPFASHGLFTPDGRIEMYRKLHIAPPEKRCYAPGDSVPVFDIGPVCLGIQLCFDAHFPEISSIMTDKGAELLFFPHASPRGSAEEKNISWTRHLSARAFDNGVYVVACNQAGENGNGLYFPGNSLIMDPLGRIIAQETSGKASMLMADLKSAELEAVRSHPMRHFFPHRRPDLYAKEMVRIDSSSKL
jgi:predicted amidohydrolase